MEVEKIYKVEPHNYRGNTHRKCGLLLDGSTVNITIYGSNTKPDGLSEMVDLTNAEPFDAEGAYVLSILPAFVYFDGTADVIELINYRVVGEYTFGGDLPMNATDLSGMGYSSETIDARLIYLASIGITGQTISIYGNSPRTSASDAAVLELTTTLDNQLIEDL